MSELSAEVFSRDLTQEETGAGERPKFWNRKFLRGIARILNLGWKRVFGSLRVRTAPPLFFLPYEILHMLGSPAAPWE